MAEEKRPILIKKVKKAGHSAHGGSWKVAYADFVTAMMAFFLLMWLLSMIDPVKKEAVAAYFNEYSVYDKGGRPFYESEKLGKQDRGAITNVFPRPRNVPRTSGTGANAPGGLDTDSNGQIAGDLQWIYEQRTPDFIDQLQIDQFAGGVRINIMDAEGRPIFESGSDTPTAEGRKLLEVTGAYLQTIRRRVAIGGHTDTTPYASAVYTNWELSAARASSARRVMRSAGFDESRLVRVSGYSDSDPFVADKPADPRNRRISITIFDGSLGASGFEVPEPFSINDYIAEHPYPPDGEKAPVEATPPEGEAAPEAPAPGGDAAPPSEAPAEGGEVQPH